MAQPLSLLEETSSSDLWSQGYIAWFPIWGLQKEEELDVFLGCSENPPSLDDEEIQAAIEKDREEFSRLKVIKRKKQKDADFQKAKEENGESA